MVQRAPKVHYFKEHCQLTSLSIPVGSFASGVITFKLTDLLNSGSFTALFDLYKLTGVKLRLITTANVSDSSVPNTSGQVGTLPMFYIAPNRDPYVPAPTSVGDILNDDGCRIIRLERPYKTYLKSPKPLILDSTGAANLPLQLGTKSSQQFWLTTGGNSQTINQSNIEHFGFRWAGINQAPNALVVQVYATYYFAMKEQD